MLPIQRPAPRSGRGLSKPPANLKSPLGGSTFSAMSLGLVPPDVRKLYECHEWRHACAILSADFPKEWQDIIGVLRDFRLRPSHITVPGGRKSKLAESIDNAFYAKGWAERRFETKIVVDEETHESPTHSVDCFKNRIALEIEWNNKDPFFDRDLNNFRLLFELRTVAVGVIITRCDQLQTLFQEHGRANSFGASTTHLSKLLPRIEGGGGGGCPILVFGITTKLYVQDDIVP
jgi:Restriction endonuclease BglII